jgi:NitT/TauT family transport system ATP-binding protein
MQQRVGIARALIRQPILLLMDEPFGALDAQTREELQDELLHVLKATQHTVLFVTHSIDEALVLSDQVIVFTPAPGRIRSVIDIPTGRAATGSDVRATPEFVKRGAEIRDLLRSERQR